MAEEEQEREELKQSEWEEWCDGGSDLPIRVVTGVQETWDKPLTQILNGAWALKISIAFEASRSWNGMVFSGRSP